MTRPQRLKYRPIVEGLDDRCLLSTLGLTPAQVAKAYGLNGLRLRSHAADGSGQTIAVIDSYNDPNILRRGLGVRRPVRPARPPEPERRRTVGDVDPSPPTTSIGAQETAP